MASVNKEFHRLMRRVGKISDGQATVEDISYVSGELQYFTLVIRPNSGLYKGGTFNFQVTVHACFESLDVQCQTEIYHPNIDTSYQSEDTNVCLNVLENPQSFGFEGIVHGLIFLMKYPNLSDPLSPYFDSTSEECFDDNVRQYMAGEEVEGTTFNTGFIVIDGVAVETKSDTETIDKVDDKGDTGTNNHLAPETVTDVNNTMVTLTAVEKTTCTQDDNPYSQRFRNPGVTAPKLRRSFSHNNLQASPDNFNVQFMRQTSLTNLPDSVNEEFKEMLDNYNYDCNTDDDEGMREFVEVDGEIYLVAAKLADALKLKASFDKGTDDVTTDGARVDPSVRGTVAETLPIATTDGSSEDSSDTCCDNTSAIAATDGLTFVRETCVDTGCSETRSNDFLDDVTDGTTQCGSWTVVKMAFYKVANLFTGSSRTYRRVNDRMKGD